jgi:hypothetical protein
LQFAFLAFFLNFDVRFFGTAGDGCDGILACIERHVDYGGEKGAGKSVTNNMQTLVVSLVRVAD